MHFERYAIYYTAPAGQLADFGASWLGWDVANGTKVAHTNWSLAGFDISEVTKTPRKYGFHGTIKPPFRLAEGRGAESLHQETQALCNQLQKVSLDGLELSQLGRFLALTPRGDASPLAKLAAHVVKELDGFRSPPNAKELEKRRKANLSPVQEQYLLDWGYPYVLEEFRFHLTLTGRLKREDASVLKSLMSSFVEPMLPSPFEVHDLTLAGEAPDGQFYEIERFPLRG